MKVHMLFDGDGPRLELHDAVEAAASTVGSLTETVARLREAQVRLASLTLDDLIGLCDAAATAWTQPEHPLAALIRDNRIGFLPLWMRRKNLETICRRSFRGRPEALDAFVPLVEADPQLVRAQPRGLVVHWLAGNVPVLGMLSFVQAVLCKNASLLKVARHSAGLLPYLLQGFAEIEYRNPRGAVVQGRMLTAAAAVIYVEKSDEAAARELSLAADVRVAWGGREAVEAIMNLPRRYGTEDIIFGPKTSLAVIGAERLGDVEAARRAAAAVAADATAFDQQGCNSPHTVFVERGGAIAPAEFASLLATAMEHEARRAPADTPDPSAAMTVLGVRTEYDMRGEAFYGPNMDWTVVYAESDVGLASPCFCRTLFVRPVDDVHAVVPFCSPATQTVGLGVDARRPQLAAALTSRGVERCPPLGAMRIYDAPWDGLFLMDRLVRWTSSF